MNSTQIQIHKEVSFAIAASSISICVFLVIFYCLCFMYLINEILYLKKKLWRIKQGPSDHETEALYTKYRAEYIKNILMLLVTVSELLCFVPICLKNFIQALSMATLDRGQYAYGLVIILTQVVCWSLCTILLSAMLYLLNLLTLYQINLLYGTFDTTLLKRKLRNLLVFSIILLLVTCTLFASIISQLIALVHVTYYMCRLIKNCKYLYILLKYRYRDSLLYHNNVPLHRAQLKIALRYKYFNIFTLTGLCVLLAGCWFSLLNTASLIVCDPFLQKLIGFQMYQVDSIIIVTTDLVQAFLGFIGGSLLLTSFVAFFIFRICRGCNNTRN